MTGKALKGEIRKRKLARRKENISCVKTDSEIEVELKRVRDACKTKVEEAIRTRIDAQEGPVMAKKNEGFINGVQYDIAAFAKAYEQELFSKHAQDLKNYRATFRKDLVAIRNQDVEFIEALLSGRVSIETFVSFSVEDLLSAKQKSIHKKINQENLKHAISRKLLPETINEIKSSFVVEKWGVSKSASSIED